MVWTLVVFGLTMFVLWKVAFPRIAEALDKRQRMIEDSIDAADKTRREADALLAEYRERLTEARNQADDIVARARRTAETAENETLAAARAKREEMMEQTRRDIETETRRAIQQIRAEVADLTVLATEKVTRKVLDDADQRRRVDVARGELDFSALTREGNE
jgi:F-type H+-transporting ATPase subunit b